MSPLVFLLTAGSTAGVREAGFVEEEKGEVVVVVVVVVVGGVEEEVEKWAGPASASLSLASLVTDVA